MNKCPVCEKEISDLTIGKFHCNFCFSEFEIDASQEIIIRKVTFYHKANAFFESLIFIISHLAIFIVPLIIYENISASFIRTICIILLLSPFILTLRQLGKPFENTLLGLLINSLLANQKRYLLSQRYIGTTVLIFEIIWLLILLLSFIIN